MVNEKQTVKHFGAMYSKCSHLSFRRTKGRFVFEVTGLKCVFHMPQWSNLAQRFKKKKKKVILVFFIFLAAGQPTMVLFRNS